ncbi:acyltransferase family protein [Stackebrandtia nassauensis]|uniref:Acyltransferase 3 n=1 Tax=Stackebrandtia nassauensis (strain DSM 44728 / CIP 108903 / NRRL B-16338 / NBRC 102104 / LLR-40K-21) TaxID=446470 RepID=D3PUW2_STANL|nr:acyltransferase family protein [Stackebrandtia nassauensis]ADD44986.1 acyltransferase 3 [Stackebrandtia nassauensis DSM 44728]
MSTEVSARGETPTTGTNAKPATAKSGKDPLLDNAKVVLIVSVVCGHAWSPLLDDSHTVRAIYLTLYAFHMPAFVMLSGYLSRSYNGRESQRYRVVSTLIVPYVVFSLLYGAMRYWTEDELNPDLLNPFFQLWFLVALLVWRLTAPIWKLVRYPVLVALVISIGASTMDLPGELDLGRLLQFLPFFVAGLFLKRDHIDALRRPLPRIALATGAAAIVWAAFAFGGEVDRHWMYLNDGAKQLGLTFGEAFLMRIVLLACAVTLIAAFLALMPGKQRWYTALGAATMYPFLLHGFFVKIAEDGFKLYENDFINTGTGALTVTACAITLAALLLSRPIRWLTKPIVEPNLDWLLKRPLQAAKPRATPTPTPPPAPHPPTDVNHPRTPTYPDTKDAKETPPPTT